PAINDFASFLSESLSPVVNTSIADILAPFFWLPFSVDFGARFAEFLRHLLHAAFLLFELRGVIAYLLRDFHGAEFRAAHGTEMRDLVTFLGQGLVVEVPRTLGIEREVELVFPAELEARFRERVVAHLRTREALAEIGGVRRDLVGDDAFAHVVLVRQAEML